MSPLQSPTGECCLGKNSLFIVRTIPLQSHSDLRLALTLIGFNGFWDLLFAAAIVCSASYLLHTYLWLGLFFSPEDGLRLTVRGLHYFVSHLDLVIYKVVNALVARSKP
jgi:hypothetical protein